MKIPGYIPEGKKESMMRLSLKAMAIAAGLLWGGAILCVCLINLVDPSYGINFIQLTSSVYPWFHASRTVGNIVIGTVDGLIDGAIAGLIFAWLYNIVTRIPTHTGHAGASATHN